MSTEALSPTFLKQFNLKRLNPTLRRVLTVQVCRFDYLQTIRRCMLLFFSASSFFSPSYPVPKLPEKSVESASNEQLPIESMLRSIAEIFCFNEAFKSVVDRSFEKKTSNRKMKCATRIFFNFHAEFQQ